MKIINWQTFCIIVIIFTISLTIPLNIIPRLDKIITILEDNSVMLSTLTIGERPFVCETVPCTYPETKFWESRKQLTKEKKK